MKWTWMKNEQNLAYYRRNGFAVSGVNLLDEFFLGQKLNQAHGG
jgi:hypothetical protein